MTAEIKNAHRCIRCGYDLAGLDSERCPECGQNVNAGVELARYTAKRLFSSSAVILFADRVVVRKSSFAAESERPIVLTMLSPEPMTARIRGARMTNGLVTFFIGGIFALLVSSDAVRRDGGVLPMVGIWICSTTSAIGLAVTLSGLRSFEITRFHSPYVNTVSILDIERIGRDVAKYDDFVFLLKQRIRQAHQAALQAAKT